MKLRTIIIDDEPIALDKLRSYVGKTPSLQLVGAYSNGLDVIEALSSGSVEADVIFTDINMPDINGLEMVGSLTTAPMIVFITAHADYAAESYRHSAVDYLLKPYSFADFQRATGKVMERYVLTHNSATSRVADSDSPRQTEAISDPGSIFIKSDSRYIRINTADIRYIKGYGEYLQVYTTSTATPLLTLSSFSAISERLSPSFVQIHRSYIVNMDHVAHIERARIVMDADTRLPVGDSYRGNLQTYLAHHSIGGNTRNK